jgi:S-adenosylmethionine:tRNA ribosyltransferase-isomerase
VIPLSDYDFVLPKEKIAQSPASPRDHSKLLVLNRRANTMEDTRFHRLIDYLNPGDLLVVNDTKVIPARLQARKTTGAKIEVFLLEEVSPNQWTVLVRPAKRVKVGDRLLFGELIEADVRHHLGEGLRAIVFDGKDSIRTALLEMGKMPLPPYIQYKEGLEQYYKDRYQTVFAQVEGAVAAPTAGLHFTPELLADLAKKGIRRAEVTLHVGLGTFKPVETEDLTQHPIHSERYSLSEETIRLINETKENGGRIIAVGTTVVRLLEGVVAQQGALVAGDGAVRIFIYPPFSFKVVDMLLTNFHLPKSTLLALVSAFYNRESLMQAYQHAIEEDYRFFSFGDAMLVV